jgi:SAM-dependent methyltransferase
MLGNPFTRRSDPYLLAVSMTGVKMGDRVLFVGCAHGGRLAAIASRVGLSGRAVAVVPDERSAALARKGAEQAGVLVEVEVAPPAGLPLEDAGADLTIVDDTGGLLGTMPASERPAAIRDIARALRPGGRIILIGAVPPSGLARLVARAAPAPPFVTSGDAPALLAANGFNLVRTLAEREGLAFVEAVKPRT